MFTTVIYGHLWEVQLNRQGTSMASVSNHLLQHSSYKVEGSQIQMETSPESSLSK